MDNTVLLQYLNNVLTNLPTDWLKLTTHRLDIYKEEKAKTHFLAEFEKSFQKQDASASTLSELPTAYDYIRLGHPLSSVLEWSIAELNGLKAEQVISFSSRTMPIMAVLRKNLLDGVKTKIVYTDKLPQQFDEQALKNIYGYNFEVEKVASKEAIPDFGGSVIYVSEQGEIGKVVLPKNVDFFVAVHSDLGSILLINGKKNEQYTADIQHVRRRETIAMTPANCFSALQMVTEQSHSNEGEKEATANKAKVLQTIKDITKAKANAIVGSSGLSVQYAIMMGLIDYALAEHAGKEIKFIVPPNCYGGTNDQARRVAAALDKVEVLDLPVDGENDMVQSTEKILANVAQSDAVPYIIAEIPTNPRVEVPDLEKLKNALSKRRLTKNGDEAVEPVFILDQTFCPNYNFLGENEILSSVQTISYVSGSKFPSGGKCTAGYCVGNEKAAVFMDKIEKHIKLCDNEATDLQLTFLAEQLPSMPQRIKDAYENTRDFVDFIEQTLPQAKINFVSKELAMAGFTPSVFSLDLPSKGSNDEEREAYKRSLNLQLINSMIEEIPNESKYCVSYGQLKGCYWTIPATSTQGTTKEDDKDYIIRASLSPDLNLEKHKQVFADFADGIK